MKNKFLIPIILIMSIALIGIIFVQVYWINNTLKINKERFTSDIKFALAKVSEDIKNKEFNNYYQKISSSTEKGKKWKEADIRRFIYEKIDTVNNEKFVFAQSVIEENYRIPTDFLESDSIKFKEIFSKEEIFIKKEKSIVSELTNNNSPEEHYIKIGRFDLAEKAYLESQFDAYINRLPINRRISNRELSARLRGAFKRRGITTDFKYGIYRKGMITSIKSSYFTKMDKESYSVPLFVDAKGVSNYTLYVSFPNENKFIFSSITKMLTLSILFILLILIVFVTTIIQILKQKQISEIKTEFINNMTHEFKTPIATINLALDAIKNPKIIGDQEKVIRYVKMIRDENKRMHTQVENVLRISKLERNQLEINKEEIDIHEVITDAITHLELIAKNRGGYIKTHFNAPTSEINGNSFHLTNAFINLLDNAIKYSNEAPEIEIFSEIIGKDIAITIKDKGIGMSKSVQKQIFKKFYREERGNIHNVKGHGLGLSYVKKIITIHNGTIEVESEKNVGSTFIVKLPKT